MRNFILFFNLRSYEHIYKYQQIKMKTKLPYFEEIELDQNLIVTVEVSAYSLKSCIGIVSSKSSIIVEPICSLDFNSLQRDHRCHQ